MRTLTCVLLVLLSARVFAQEAPLDLRLPDEWQAVRPAVALNRAGQLVIVTNLGQMVSRRGWTMSAAFRSTYLGTTGQQLVLSAKRADWFGEVSGGMNISRRDVTTNVGYKTKVADVVDLNAAAWYWRPYGQPGLKPQGAKTFSASVPLAQGLTFSANMARASASIAVDCRRPCFGLQWQIPL